ncbi:NUDIX domain-containing protein [Brachybacterium sp. UMB0905]|uniref:NUDIX domain-containing protein n=1 Tax=Brachybacterium sp. UMB0905 TaxID=2069310 RepID=UPI000C80AFF7|nr:NUDIX hydrolase [Brachybacterium sp. UMB0905]PMC76006.1 NUDIX hydrolase [Brachybacterium sp. UMB0905]
MPNRSPLLPCLLRAGHQLQRLWWRVRRPRTFGVQVLLRHPDRSGRVLAVRHSYADPERWSLPGGGYRPRRESAQDAARREVREELGLEVTGTLAVLTTRTVTTSGKRDTVTVLTGTAASADAHLSYELREARWVRPDLTDLAGEPTSQWLRMALDRLRAVRGRQRTPGPQRADPRPHGAARRGRPPPRAHRGPQPAPARHGHHGARRRGSCA